MATPIVEQDLVYDAWTPMSFKRVLGSKKQPGTSWLAPTWVGEEHQRRLMAYKLLAAYLDNASRFFRSLTANSVRAVDDDLREYGDANLIRQQALSAMLGEEPSIVVEGADQFDPEADDNTPEAQAAFDQQEWIQTWADKERFGLKLHETERNAIGLGDGVYSLGINYRRKRVRLRTWDPGFYFPVLDDNDDDEFPDRVHFAWEIELTDQPEKVFVRRITFDLRQLPDGQTRQHPWNEEPVDFNCYLTDATWELDKEHADNVDDFAHSTAKFEEYRLADGTSVPADGLDLDLDFIPAIHIPNTIALADHFGRSVIALVLQILDDLMNADTDLNASSATTGKPPVGISGVRMREKPVYKAGAIWELGEEGKLTTLDTTGALAALQNYVEFLLKRLSVNVRIPEEILGRVAEGSGDGQLAGVSRRMKFGPFESLVREMHQVRDDKYRLLFKMVWRMSLKAGFENVPAEWVDTWLAYGSYLPADEAAAAEMVGVLLTAKAISVETGIRILMAAGLPIDDVGLEALQMQSRDFVGANALLDATGSEEAVFDYLGLDKSLLLKVQAEQAAAAPVTGTPPGPGQPPTPPTPPPTAPVPPGNNPAGERGAVA